MKTVLVGVSLMFCVVAAFGEPAFSKVVDVPGVESPLFPSGSLNVPVGEKVRLAVPGKAGTLPVGVSTDGLEGAVAIDITREYDLGGQKKTSQFQVLYYGLESVSSVHGDLNRGDVLGVQGAKPVRVVVSSSTLDPYLALGSNRIPVKYANRYWFSPSFLFPNGPTAYLTFDTSPDIDKALAHVASEASEEGPGYVFYPSYRVRFATKLGALPVALTDEEKSEIAGYEKNLYGRSGLYQFKNEIQVGEYRYLLCWQSGFDKYLKEEYTLGTEVWLYGSIVTYDVWRKVGYVFLRDFSPLSAETMVQNRFDSFR